jgi:hypothetical protein
MKYIDKASNNILLIDINVPDYQQVIYFTATPTTSTTFTLSINFGIQSKISRLKLSFIIFDQVNV